MGGTWLFWRLCFFLCLILRLDVFWFLCLGHDFSLIRLRCIKWCLSFLLFLHLFLGVLGFSGVYCEHKVFILYAMLHETHKSGRYVHVMWNDLSLIGLIVIDIDYLGENMLKFLVVRTKVHALIIVKLLNWW